jgi:hypothetical protein
VRPDLLIKYSRDDTCLYVLGVSGVFVGGTVAILRGSTAPVLFMLASGAQWFCLGGAFWGTYNSHDHTLSY